jgi:hypothetical protein
MDIKDFSALIGCFYTAAQEPDRWPETAAHIAGFFGSESAAIQVRTGDFSRVVWRATTANYDYKARQDYAAYYYKLDPFANAIRGNGTLGIFAGHELVDLDELVQGRSSAQRPGSCSASTARSNARTSVPSIGRASRSCCLIYRDPCR